MDSKPMQPKFRNLEVFGSWDGEFEGPVRLKISLEVESAPDTELRLLDTKSSAIFLKTVSARLLSDESNDSSSLFTFSTPDSGKLKGARRVSAERLPNSEEAFSVLQDGPPLPSRSLMKDITTCRDTSPADISSAEKFSSLCINVAEYDDLTKSPQLVKRSAADACFTDSGSDSAPTHKRHDSSNDTQKTLTLGSISTTAEENIKSAKLIGLEAWLETATQQPGDRPLDEGIASTGDGEPYLEEKTPDGYETEADGATGSEEVCRQSTSVAGSSNAPLREESPTMERLYNSSPVPRTHTPCDQEGSPSGLSASPGLGLGITGDLNDDLNARPSSPYPSLLFSTPDPSNSKPETWENHYLIEETNRNDNEIEIQPLIEFSWSDPKLTLSNGDLIMKFSTKTRQATYKIEVNLTVYVDDDYAKGWSTILLPGLPYLQAEETGSFLFRLPEDRGLEFRTADKRRCMEVENCFFAEFINTGYLAVSMRVCGRRFYGFLKHIVLDQEIISRHAVAKSGAENDGSINYYAMCSLRSNRRYICSEKCGFSFYVDGGPDGFFICKLEHQKTRLQMIEIPRGDSASVGISRVQVICSPKDLGVFCLAWSIPSTDRHADHWLPHIYSASPGRLEEDRDGLRGTFTGLSTRGIFPVAKEDDKQLLREDIGADKEGHKSDDKASVGPDLSTPGVPDAPGVLLLFRLLVSTLMANASQSTKGCIKTAFLSLSCLYDWTCSSMTRLSLALGAMYGLLGLLVWFFVKDAGLDVLDTVQGQSSSLDSSEMATMNLTMANQDAGAILDDSVFKPDHLSSRVSDAIVGTEKDTGSERQVLVDSAEDSDKEDTETDFGDTTTLINFRDRIDYWLGWRGPVN
ncbi:uncharacterized protein KD926_005469 [Aspergillus affinis]|uniref:uncharacterized protein n=1 Tax=Aspergillus affinis TaxID=1070780 RepID=UPI0022FF301A|nr:uncharacterized protein KD926_005469 [Aspergillus affinis]KAI9034795.1 hypothetical protein KD926_005469 [Aspergillus affinis]